MDEKKPGPRGAEIIWQLSAPFHADAIQWRVQQKGGRAGKSWALVLPYVDARTVATRLDEVLGIDWADSYQKVGSAWVCCLSVRTESGHWIVRSDGAEETDIESVKGGISDSFKRAAVKWGVGRYVYEIPTCFVEGRGGRPPKGAEGHSLRWRHEDSNWWAPFPEVPAEFRP